MVDGLAGDEKMPPPLGVAYGGCGDDSRGRGGSIVWTNNKQHNFLWRQLIAILFGFRLSLTASQIL